jgi:hypothetical protein
MNNNESEKFNLSKKEFRKLLESKGNDVAGDSIKLEEIKVDENSTKPKRSTATHVRFAVEDNSNKAGTSRSSRLETIQETDESDRIESDQNASENIVLFGIIFTPKWFIPMILIAFILYSSCLGAFIYFNVKYTNPASFKN